MTRKNTMPARRSVPAETAAKVKKPVQDELDIETAPQQGVRWGYAALLAFGIVVLAACSAMAAGKKMTGWEHTLFVKINGADLPEWVTNQVAKPLSNAVWGILGLAIVMLAFRKYRLMAWQYVVAGGSAFVFEAIIEQIIGRGRPEVLTHDVILRAHQGGAGFPSGHVSVLSAFCFTMWAYVSWPWRIVLLALIGAEAWSRLFLGVHSPLDVIAGVGVGCVIVGALHLLPLKIRSVFRLHP